VKRDICVFLLFVPAIVGLTLDQSGAVDILWTADCETDYTLQNENFENLKGAHPDTTRCGHGPYCLVYLVWDKDADGIDEFSCSRELSGDSVVDSSFIGTGVFCAGCSTGGFIQQNFAWTVQGGDYDTFYIIALNDSTLAAATRFGTTQQHTPARWVVHKDSLNKTMRCTSNNSWNTARSFEHVTFSGSSIVSGGLQPGDRKVPMEEVSGRVSWGQALWSWITVDNGPSAGCTNDWQDIDSVKIYREVTGSGFDPDDDLLIGESQWGSGPPAGGTATVTFFDPETLKFTAKQYYIIFDIAAGANRENCVAACVQDSSYMGVPDLCRDGNFPFCSEDVGLPVEISRFEVFPGDQLVMLQWTTQSEIDNKGFYIYRAFSREGEFSELNEELIPGAGNSYMPIDYEYIDRDVENGREYFYKLVSVTYGNALSTYEGLVSGIPSKEPRRRTTGAGLFGLSPNPFTSTSMVSYVVGGETGSFLKLEVYDSAGRLVRVLLDGYAGPGVHSAEWDGRGDSGSLVSSGLYFCRLTSGDNLSVMKMVRME